MLNFGASKPRVGGGLGPPPGSAPGQSAWQLSNFQPRACEQTLVGARPRSIMHAAS